MPEMSGSRFFAQAMHGYGLTHVFFVPTILTPALAAMEGLGITRVMAHGEKAAAYMADGYARAARRPGVCMAQTVGASNLAAGLKDAYLACSPVVAISGGPVANSRYRFAYQEIDDFTMFKPVTKFSARVESVERLPDLLRQAFRAATTGTPGPAHLELPGEQGQQVFESADLELRFEERFTRVPPFRPEPEPEAVQAALRALAEAERPVIVAGNGVTLSGAEAELMALAERLQIPVATSLNAKSAIRDDHPLAIGVPGTYSRACANQVLCEADLVFFVGSRTGGMLTHFWAIPPRGVRTIQLDINPEELGRNYPNAVSLLGDVQTTLRRLLEASEPRPIRQTWLDRVQGLVAEWRVGLEVLASSPAVPLRPERICREISEYLPDDAVLVTDTGHAGMWTAQAVALRPGQRYIRAAGSLGWGLPAALGVKCALPDRPVLLFSGDGGFFYHLPELETAARYGINAVLLVNDNQSMNQEIRPFNAAYGGKQHEGFEMWQFEPAVDLVKTAESLGCLGRRVERPEELRPALEWAFAAERPVVLDVRSDMNVVAPRAWTPGG
jgi:acetolactate synthase I/II/III large subunit